MPICTARHTHLHYYVLKQYLKDNTFTFAIQHIANLNVQRLCNLSVRSLLCFQQKNNFANWPAKTTCSGFNINAANHAI
jgi:hypothetical protein